MLPIDHERRGHGPLATGLLVLLLAAGVHAGDNTQDDLARAREKIAAAQQRVADVRQELGSSQTALRDAEKAVARISGELRALRQRERAIAQQAGKLQAERDALVQKTQRQAEAIAGDARDAWMLGRQQQLRLWLGSDDPQKVARMLRYYDYLNRERARRLEEYRTATAALAAAQESLAREQQSLAAARDELAARERELGGARDERRKAVAQLAGELRARKGELKRLREDEAALKRLSTTVREAWRDVPPEATGAPLAQRKGKLRWPVAGRIAARYGSPVAEGKLTLNGILIDAAEGSEVRAVHGGRVVYADWLRGYGMLVIVDHGDGLLSIYGHNASLLRTSGDWVKEGEPIATVGMSGGRGTPGLYFEIRSGGEPQDPSRWLRR